MGQAKAAQGAAENSLFCRGKNFTLQEKGHPAEVGPPGAQSRSPQAACRVRDTHKRRQKVGTTGRRPPVPWDAHTLEQSYLYAQIL